jgi:hypothetical protein
MVKFSHFAGGAFDHNMAQRDLAVAANGDLHALRRLASDADDGGAVKLFHGYSNRAQPLDNKGPGSGEKQKF